MTVKPQRFAALDSLRGIAALLVVLYHLPAWYTPLYQLEVVRNGGLMVNFFFVLSGFVLFHGYADRFEDRGHFARFVVLRLGRVYPLHLVFLLLFFATEVAKYVASARGLESRSPAFAENSPAAFLESLFLVQALGFSEHHAAYNFPSWSISTEFYTYVLFAVAALLLTRRQFVVFAILISAGALTLVTMADAQIGDFRWWARCIAGFFAGCALGQAYRLLSAQKFSGAWPLLALSSLIGFLNLDLHDADREWVLPTSAVVVLSLALVPGGLASSILLWRPLCWMGEVSYALYMCHALVLWVARQLCRVVLKAPEVIIDGAATAQVSEEVGIALSCGSVLASLALASLSSRLVERPWRTRARIWVESGKSGVTLVTSPRE